jgi:diacylglycerol kinase family enzyme/membrane-associated phospholipid phosphatase
MRNVSRLDETLVRRSAALPRTRLDRALTSLTKSANHGVLWFAIAAVSALRAGSTRRAALRGIAAIGAASTSANLIGKRLFPRRRPAAELLPVRRRLTRRPTSSSFPSGHAASAAAFGTAVAMENRTLGAAVLPLAAVVGYSRVHTGVHWPTDVLVGWLIGAGSALATRHWWPLHPDRPARTTHAASARPMTEGDGLLMLVNPDAGVGLDPTDAIAAVWPRATVLRPEPGADIVEQLADRISEPPQDVRAIGVAGGDGTIAAAAAVAAEHRLPLVVVPTGTLNHFARDVGIASLADALAAVAAGTAVRIDLAGVDVHDTVGEVRHRWFVNTASLGGYPEMVRLRERLEPRWGKWPATALALARTLRRAAPLRVTLNGRPALVWMLFVGNSPYEPKGFGVTRRLVMDTGLLDVRYLRADLPYSRARFVLATLTRTLHTSHVYRQHDVSSLRVEVLDGSTRIATDGEVGPLGRRFIFRSRPGALTVYRPASAS